MMKPSNAFTLLLLASVLLVPVSAARAADTEFDAVVRHIEKTYHARRNDPGGMWFARIAMKFAQPKGVKGFKIAMFENLSGPATDPRLGEIVRDSLDASWRPIVRASSRIDRDQTYVYVRPSGNDIELLIVAVDDEEATVIKAKVNPKSIGSWIKDLDS